jgi:methionyl-tRNA formyltransferase
LAPDPVAPSPASRLRLGFAGTPEFAAVILGALLDRHDVAVVYCQPPRPTGRGRKVASSAVETLARSHGLTVRTPRSLRGEAAALASDQIDALVVAAYGLMLPPGVLATPRYGCINVHASLLPRWRGAAPIERAIMAGDRVTGVSIMQMDAGLDTGPVFTCVECTIEATDTGDSLHDRLAVLGANALLECLERLGSIVAKAQPDAGVTYAEKLAPIDSMIRWDAPAVELANRIRALNSRQPAFCFVGDERVRLLFAESLNEHSEAPPGTVVALNRSALVVACGSGQLRITRLALTRGKGKPMDVASLLNGYPHLVRAGQNLDAPS